MSNLETLGNLIESRDEEERREAAIGLGQLGKEAVPLLLRALSDRNWRVRKTVVEALVSIANERVIHGLIQALNAHDNAGARNSAMEALVRIGAPVVDALLPASHAPDPDVRKFIIDILGDIQDRRATPALISRLEDPDENVRVAAAEALGKIRDPRAVDALLICLNRSGQGWLDYAAAEALGEIGDARALGPLLAALGRSSLREPVIESLGKIGNSDTLLPLLTGLADPLRIVREASVAAIIEIHRKSAERERLAIIQTVRAGASDQAVDLLEESLGATEGDMRKAVIFLLGLIGRESSIRKLLAFMQEEALLDLIVQSFKFLNSDKASIFLDYISSENSLVRRVVAETLGAIGSREGEEPLIGLLADENGHVRSSAAAALGRLRSRKAARLLIRLLEDEYQNVQEAAIDALGAIGDASVLDGLIRDFSSRDASLRRNIALLLGKFLTEKKAADALLFALKDEEPNVRKAVVQSLAEAPDAKAVRSLRLAITDDDPEVRMLAADALGRTTDAKACDDLIPLLDDDDLWVRAAAARGLGRIGGEKAAAALSAHLDTATDILLLVLVEVLGQLKVTEAERPLLALTNHPDPEVRKTVLPALCRYESEAAQSALISRLTDQHWSVRKAAIDVFKMKRCAGAEALIEKIADTDPDTSVRQAAREALGR